MRDRRRPPVVSVIVLLTGAAFVLLAAGCASSTPPDTVALQLQGAGGNGLSVEVSSSLVRGAVESALGASLERRGTLGPPLSTLLLELEQGGPRARATVRREGDVLRAWRYGSRLRLVVSGDDGGQVEIRMPWAVAEWLLGRDATLQEALARNGGRPTLEVRIAGKEGGRFEAALK